LTKIKKLDMLTLNIFKRSQSIFLKSPLTKLVLIPIMMMAACDTTIEPQVKEVEPQEMSADTVIGSDIVQLSVVRLHLVGHSNPGVTYVKMDIRDANGVTVIASLTRYFTGSFNGPQQFAFAAPVSLFKGKKYRIYLTRVNNNYGTLMWAGENDGSGYAPGRSSEPEPFDFAFETTDSSGKRDQFCSGDDGDIARRVVTDKFLWQEFVPGDPSVLLSDVTAFLSVNLYSSENLYAVLQNEDGTAIATSLPTQSGTINSGWKSFSFPGMVTLDKTKKYRIQIQRSWFDIEPGRGVFWHYSGGNPYPGGRASLDPAIDMTFNALSQSQPNGPYSYPVFANEYSLWQEFVPLP
jgi:hypothetical protein